MGKTRELFKKIRDIKGTFTCPLKYSDDKRKVGSLVKVNWAIDLNIFSINLLSELLKKKI